MAWTQATPNGGNSAKTGHRNKNNNASANRQTSNYGSGNSNSSSSSGDPRGDEGNGYTNYLTPAPTPVTPIYSSPHEQGQNNTDTITTKKDNVTNNTTTNNNYIENDYEDDWIKTWADSYSNASDSNFNALQTNFAASNKQNADNISSNYQLIGENENSIASNLESTGRQMDGLEGDFGTLFNDVGDVEDSIDSTNKNVDGLGLDLSNLGGDLEGLAKVQQDYGLQLIDQNGNVVDLQRDIIANKKSQQQGQMVDQAERRSQDSAITKALEDVDYQFGDITKAQAELGKGTASSFKLADDAIENLSSDLGDLGLDMNNITFGLDEDIKNQGTALSAASDEAMALLETTITDKYDGKITSVKEYVDAVQTKSIKVDREIEFLLSASNTAQIAALNESRKEVDNNLGDALKTVNKADQSILDTMDKYNTAQTRSLEEANQAQDKTWGGKFSDEAKRVDTVQSDANKADQSILDTMNKYNTAQGKIDEGQSEAIKDQSDTSQTALDALDSAINDKFDGQITSVQEYMKGVENGIIQKDAEIEAMIKANESASDEANKDQDITWASEFSDEAERVDTAVDEMGTLLKEEYGGQFETVDEYIKAVENGIIQSNADIEALIKSNDEKQASALDESSKGIITDTYKARKALLAEINKGNDGKLLTLKDYVDGLDESGKEASEEIVRLMGELDTALAKSNTDNKNANDAQDEAAVEKDRYDQKYWSNRLKELKANGLSESNVQKQLKKEMSILKDKTYSGDTIVTEEDHITAWADINSAMYDLGITDAGPHAPKEYMYETFLSNIDQWVKDGKVSVETSTSGMFDENTTNIYTLPNGKQAITKGTSPMFTDEDGKEFRFGDDTLTLYMDGVDLGSRDGDITTVTKQGEANHVDSTVNIGDDTNPNSAGNRTGGKENSTPLKAEAEAEEGPEAGEPTDPVVGEDIPLPNDLTDPDGAGAYGQDGREFTLDGVTYWKRIKDRNGRWTYTRLDSYQSNSTASRRAGWGENVQNF